VPDDPEILFVLSGGGRGDRWRFGRGIHGDTQSLSPSAWRESKMRDGTAGGALIAVTRRQRIAIIHGH
jgi:hypothetical protein